MYPFLVNIFLISITNLGISQADTLVFTYNELFLLNCNNDYIIKDEICYYKNIQYRVYEFDSIRKSLNSKPALTGSLENPTYCILLDDKKNKSEEGIWDLECFWGPYKKYFSNGKIEMEGSFVNLYETTACNKINDWKYYNERGDLIRTETYDKKGQLVSRKNYKWKLISKRFLNKRRK
jgi:hypothetical protein